MRRVALWLAVLGIPLGACVENIEVHVDSREAPILVDAVEACVARWNKMLGFEALSVVKTEITWRGYFDVNSIVVATKKRVIGSDNNAYTTLATRIAVEDWMIDDPLDDELEWNVCHEFGHTFALQHTDRPNLMQPFPLLGEHSYELTEKQIRRARTFAVFRFALSGAL